MLAMIDVICHATVFSELLAVCFQFNIFKVCCSLLVIYLPTRSVPVVDINIICVTVCSGWYFKL